MKRALVAVVAVLGGLLALPAGASAAPPSLEDRLNVVPPDYLEGIFGSIERGDQTGAFLRQVLCPPATELDELATDVPVVHDVTGPAETVACNLDLLDYSFHVEYLRPDGSTLVRNEPALVNVPEYLNVDDDPAFELVGTIRVLSLEIVTVEIDRLQGVTEPLPASVEAIIRDPSRGSLPRDRIAYGYDAKESSAPVEWQTDLRIGQAFDDPVKLGVDFITRGATGPVAVVGEIFNPGPGVNDRRERLGGRVRFDPVPDRVSVDLTLGERIEALLRTSVESTVDALARIQENDDETRIEARIDKLPRQVLIAVEETGTDERRVDYDALSGIERLDVRFTQREDAPLFDNVTTTAELNVRDVPHGLTVEQRGARRAKLTTRGGPIGRIDGAFATGGAPIREAEDGHYVKLVQDEGFTSAAFRILGLERAEFIGTNPVLLDAVLEAGPFRADVRTPELDLQAEIRDVPHDLRLQLDTEMPRLIYDGNGAGIEEISLNADSPTPFFGRVTHVVGSIRDIPSVLQLDLRQTGEKVEFVTDNPIGSIELLASSGPGEQLPAGEQGVILRDLPDRFVIFGRIFGLRSVSLDMNPLAFGIQAGQGLPFRAEATLQQPGDDLEVSARIEDLPRRIDLSLGDDGSGGTEVVYDADAPINRILLEANNLALIDRADDVRAEILGLPQHIEVKLPTTGPLLDAEASDPIGSMQLQVAEGAFENLAANRDGVIYIDTPTRFAITAKVSRLRGVKVVTDPAPDVLLDLPDAPNPFDFDVQRQEFADEELEYFRGTIDRPQRDTRVRLHLPDPKLVLSYSAGGAIPLITLESNTGELGLLEVSLANLPRELEVCFDSGPDCRRPQSPDSNALVSVDIDDHNTAIGPIDIDGFICLRPKTEVDCRNTPQQFVTIENLRLREFAMDAFSDGITDTGAFIDTDNRDVTGNIEYRDDDLPIIDGLRISLPAGFRAENRQAGIFSSSGSIACPSGTFIGTINPDIDLAGLLC